MKVFFLKVWTKNMGAHYTEQNTVSGMIVLRFTTEAYLSILYVSRS